MSLDEHARRNRRGAVTRAQHPPGYEPGVEVTETGGKGTHAVEVSDDDTAPDLPDEEWLIEGFGLDPEEWSIVDGSLGARKWMRYDGQWLHYYKANLKRRRPVERRLLDHLVDRTANAPKLKRRKAGTRGTFVCLITDTQIGKTNNGHGTEEFISHLAASVDDAVARLHELRDRGRWTLDHVVLAFGGDMIEGTGGNYPAQPFQIDLGLRDQIHVAALSCDYAVERFLDAGAASKLTTMWVPSNHGENRSGKSIATDERDSTDLIIADQLARAYSKNKRYSRVDVVVPWGNHTTICQPLADGTRLGLAHSHQAGHKDTVAWWRDQMTNPAQPLADADILLTGHRHHLRIQDVAAGRTLIQGPAMEPGSRYFTEFAGDDSPPGLVTFVANDKRPHDIELIRLPQPTKETTS